jgi:hypothetical protein
VREERGEGGEDEERRKWPNKRGEVGPKQTPNGKPPASSEWLAWGVCPRLVAAHKSNETTSRGIEEGTSRRARGNGRTRTRRGKG